MRATLAKLGVCEFDVAPGASGQFDVWLDGVLRFSRHASGGFPSDAEIRGWLQPRLPL